MIIKTLVGLVITMFAGLTITVFPPAYATDDVFSFVYLQRDIDPFYKPHRAYTGLVLRDHQRPLDGVRMALKHSRIVTRALGIQFALVEKSLKEEEDSANAIEVLTRSEGTGVFLLDLPVDEVADLGKTFADRNILLFNIRHPDDYLRGSACSPVLFHTLPSHSMLTDALSQFLVRKNWKEVLVLEGKEEADRIFSAAFLGSARKFRLAIADVRSFVLSNDPRLRDQNNISLLTAGDDHDVVFLADTVGEFGRYVPYNTQQPRPVTGSEGLTPNAWHWTWERHGAPQLNQRFHKIANRRMGDTDYAAWIAVRSVVEAIARTQEMDTAAIRAFLTSEDFTLDTYKGAPGNFRPWDNQLRQAILMHSHNAVIARAPMEGFLHEKNFLDTLGADESESLCKIAGR